MNLLNERIFISVAKITCGHLLCGWPKLPDRKSIYVVRERYSQRMKKEEVYGFVTDTITAATLGKPIDDVQVNVSALTCWLEVRRNPGGFLVTSTRPTANRICASIRNLEETLTELILSSIKDERQ